MSKKYNPKNVKLDSYEQSIENALDFKRLKKPSKERNDELKKYARKSLGDLKSARTNIRMSEKDMNMLLKLAEKSGIPYQTLISQVLHLYVTDQLVNINEVKKMIDAGFFTKKTG